ncbi:50S ribosomal protein L6 [Candidatus Desulforudis audaxviator]|uniref:Large ribosomal subunit protein uL6 n=1 Tax=Desulforudis audaxviator (strain MP104C) TaxID=477974 RepID=RL6_DESAP|nr:50S ribosomal protein L6 [Candidatus Desulforudis audaxviator]B1I1L4.1 RecName: Full=Large ribosomal subunit protein uL6; AltName: Full=50S ribosomal protein L6 [Candidatus Desulforudis audaxviator MP104C]ACA58801.1 ribosomal protein L6 [Candidatus Desulforudis audaxviator MP104C]
MSRIGRMPIKIPPDVKITIEGNTVRVEGPKGRLEREIPANTKLVVENGRAVIEKAGEEKPGTAMLGLTRTLVANMVDGVTKGFQRNLELTGVGYRASLQGRKLVMTLGYSHPVEYEPPADIEIEVPAVTRIIIRGADKEKVGRVAAKIRSFRSPEPYKGKGVRYEGEKIRLKAGKAGLKKR